MLNHPTSNEIVVVGYYWSPAGKLVAKAKHVLVQEGVLESLVVNYAGLNQTGPAGHAEYISVCGVSCSDLEVVAD